MRSGWEYPCTRFAQNAVRAAVWDIRWRLPGLAGSQRSLNVWPCRGGATCHGMVSCSVVTNALPAVLRNKERGRCMAVPGRCRPRPESKLGSGLAPRTSPLSARSSQPCRVSCRVSYRFSCRDMSPIPSKRGNDFSEVTWTRLIARDCLQSARQNQDAYLRRST
jgi:hypothetical protein